jgi:hypothetical protein
MRLTPEQEAAYALNYDLARDSLKPDVQVEYDRQLEIRRSQGRVTAPDATFPALGVQVRGEAVESYGAPLGAGALGLLAGAEARLTDGTGSPSSSAPATAKNSSASRHHDQQGRHGARA